MTEPTSAGALRKRRRENLARILCAKSAVFIGGATSEDAITYCRDLGFSGQLAVVNPKRDTLAGITCVPSIDDLSFVPDVAWVAVPASATVDIIRALSQMGCAGAVCYSAGFAETGNHDLEAALAEAAGPMALLGPNCTGFTNFVDGVAVTVGEHAFNRPSRGVACVAQSGTFASLLAESQRSLPLTHFISVGNQTCIDLADAVSTLADDNRVDAIVVYLEGLRDAQAFADAAEKCLRLNKPVICLLGGETDAGRTVTMSHTGALSASSALYDAFFRRLGIVRATSLSHLIETAKLFTLGRRPKGRRIAVETASGTDAARVTDLGERHGIVFPQPNADLAAKLQDILPDIAAARNPVDVTMMLWGDRNAQAEALSTLIQVGVDAAAIVVDTPERLSTKPSYMIPILAMADVARETDVPCYIISNLPEGLPEGVRAKLIAVEVVPLQGIDDAFAALNSAADYLTRRAKLLDTQSLGLRLLPGGTRLAGPVLSEAESKRLIADFGVRIPENAVVDNMMKAGAAAVQIGFPVVLKGAGAALAHKSELGAVVVGLHTEAAVEEAAQAMAEIPGLQSFLVEEMITASVAEIIAGVIHDPVFGLCMVVGAGGVFTEVLDDTAHLILPTSKDEIRRAVLGLKIYKLMAGFRGAPRADVDALVVTIDAIAKFAVHEANRLVELDVNPILVLCEGSGAVAVDAMMHVSVAPNG